MLRFETWYLAGCMHFVFFPFWKWSSLGIENQVRTVFFCSLLSCAWVVLETERSLRRWFSLVKPTSSVVRAEDAGKVLWRCGTLGNRHLKNPHTAKPFSTFLLLSYHEFNLQLVTRLFRVGHVSGGARWGDENRDTSKYHLVAVNAFVVDLNSTLIFAIIFIEKYHHKRNYLVSRLLHLFTSLANITHTNSS